MTPPPAPNRRHLSRPRRPRPKPPAPGHAEWEVLCALLAPGRVVDLYEDGGRLTRAVLPASRESPTSAPVSRAAALSLLAHGWLARTTGRRLGGTRITSYRLSLRGWYAVRRTAPHMAAAPPPGKRPAAAPTEIAPPPASA